MRRSRKFYLRLIGIIVLVIFVGLWIAFNSVLKLNHEKKFGSLLEGSPLAESIFIETQLGEVHYVTAGNAENPKVLLVHGSPGSWDAWMTFLKDSILLEEFYFISVDRPGFGLTKVGYQTRLQDQALAIHPILDNYDEPLILIGHSYGGAVIQQLALDKPHKVSHLFYVAGTLEPEAQKPRWYNKVANTKLVSLLLSDVWNASSKEMIGLYKSLKSNESKLKNMEIPTYFMHGKKDVLVPFSAVDYYKKHGPENGIEYIILEDENHFIPFTKPHLIKDVLLTISKSFLD